MERNFFRRVEIAFPVLRKELRERITRDLETYLADNTNAWELRPDGTYARIAAGNASASDAQAQLLERYAGVVNPSSQG
jgi:polyphosphate kinase